jgi:hypothetical protein
MLFPPSVFPLWKPPFRLPPFKLNPPKGDNRRGTQHGGFPVRRTERGPLSRSFSVRRTPPPYGLPDATPPLSHPLRRKPLSRGWRVDQAYAGSRSSHGSGLLWCRLSPTSLRATPLAPFSPLAGGQARSFCSGARCRARRCACKTRVGLRPTPRLYARVIRPACHSPNLINESIRSIVQRQVVFVALTFFSPSTKNKSVQSKNSTLGADLRLRTYGQEWSVVTALFCPSERPGGASRASRLRRLLRPEYRSTPSAFRRPAPTGTVSALLLLSSPPCPPSGALRLIPTKAKGHRTEGRAQCKQNNNSRRSVT